MITKEAQDGTWKRLQKATVASFEPEHDRRVHAKLYKSAVLIISCAALALCALTVVAQLVYPVGRALPDAELAGSSLALKDNTEISQALGRLDKQPFTLILGSKTYHVTPHDAGMTFATSNNVATILSYPLSQRLIPFSILWQHKASIQDSLRPNINMPELESLATRLAADSNAQPVEGIVTVENGRVIEHQPVPGVHYTSGQIITTLENLTIKPASSIVIRGLSIPPVYDAGAVHEAATRAASIIKPFTLAVNGTQYTISTNTIGSWLTFTPDATTKQIDIGIDHAAAQAYLEGIAKPLYRAPTTTTITLLDGRETGRQAGAAGSQLDTDAAATTIATALISQASQSTISLSAVASPVSYVRNYSNTQAGLQALLDYLVASKGTYGIAVQEISGRGWTASSSGDRQFVTASTYKLFVAYSTLKRIESGEFTWGDSTYNTDLATCFNRMIVNSDNPCAEALGNRIGWDTVINEMHGLGLNSTSHSDTFYSTANDEALLLTQLARGTILTETSRNLLISLMEQQQYRLGIPAGTGVTVADKVGFLWGLLHDAGIVYSPQSTYVLVILTNDSSWSQIADAARQIQAQMSR